YLLVIFFEMLSAANSTMVSSSEASDLKTTKIEKYSFKILLNFASSAFNFMAGWKLNKYCDLLILESDFTIGKSPFNLSTPSNFCGHNFPEQKIRIIKKEKILIYNNFFETTII